MIIATIAGQVPFRQMTFPDGQRHIELLEVPSGERVVIETALRQPDDLFDVALAKNILDMNGCTSSLCIRYMTGARMDRRINHASPFTLEVVARWINALGFFTVSVLDPHSKTTCEVLANAKPMFPTGILAQVLCHYQPNDSCIVVPDEGARGRVEWATAAIPKARGFRKVQCTKLRDSTTGALSARLSKTPPL